MSDARLPSPSSSRAGVDPLAPLLARGQAALPELIALLGEPKWAARRQVVAALAGLGDAAVPALSESLRSRRDDETRIAATVEALVASTGNVEGLLQSLASHEDAAVVADVAQILGRRRNRASIPTLVELSRHESDNVAVAAIEALGRVGGRTAIDALVAAVDSGHFFRVFPAIDVLGRTGDPRAVEPLARLLRNAYFGIEAARALGRTGDRAAVFPLSPLLCSPIDAHVRVAAVALAELYQRHVEQFGTSAPVEQTLRKAVGAPAVRRLAQCLNEAEADEQLSICRLLGIVGTEMAAASLTHMLDAPENVACEAARALKRLGQSADEQLLQALQEGDNTRRLVLLPLITTASASDHVVMCLADADAKVRALACETLARIGNPDVVPALFELLLDVQPTVVQAATAAIQALGSSRTLELSMAAANSSVPASRRAAVQILSYFGYEETLDAFVARLSDSDTRVRDSAILGLPLFDNPRVSGILLELAKEPSPRVRAVAMRALGALTADVAIIDCLLSGLADSDAWVRYYACQSLGKIRAERAVEAIAGLLEDAAGQVRVAAVESLSHLRSDVAFDALRRALESSNIDVQRAAIIGLGLSKRAQAIPALLGCVAADDAATRLVALSALAEFGTETLAALARAAKDADENVRTAAIGFLGDCPDQEATSILVSLLSEAAVHERALAALSRPHPDRIVGLVRALETASDELAPKLTSLLARSSRAEASIALFEALKSRNAAARKAVATTLVGIGHRDAYKALQRLSIEDPNLEVRRVCSLLLAQ